jgi:hypothetical protein
LDVPSCCGRVSLDKTLVGSGGRGRGNQHVGQHCTLQWLHCMGRLQLISRSAVALVCAGTLTSTSEGRASPISTFCWGDTSSLDHCGRSSRDHDSRHCLARVFLAPWSTCCCRDAKTRVGVSGVCRNTDINKRGADISSFCWGDASSCFRVTMALLGSNHENDRLLTSCPLHPPRRSLRPCTGWSPQVRNGTVRASH